MGSLRCRTSHLDSRILVLAVFHCWRTHIGKGLHDNGQLENWEDIRRASRVYAESVLELLLEAGRRLCLSREVVLLVVFGALGHMIYISTRAAYLEPLHEIAVFFCYRE